MLTHLHFNCKWRVFIILLIFTFFLTAFFYSLRPLFNTYGIWIWIFGAICSLVAILIVTHLISQYYSRLLRLISQSESDLVKPQTLIESCGDIKLVAQKIYELRLMVKMRDSTIKEQQSLIEQLRQQLESKKTEEERIVSDFLLKEMTVEEEKNKLSVVLSGITDAVVAVDKQQRVVLFNKAAERLTGYSTTEVIGQPIYKLFHIYDGEEELAAEEYCPINSWVEGRPMTTISKQDLRLIGNKEADVNLTAGIITGSGNANLGCILTLHDITKEKQLEEMRLNFLSMAAHELRTPLTSLKGYLTLLTDTITTKLTADEKTIIRRMDIALKQLMSLIENLLSVTRIDRGAFTINPKPIDWVMVVKETVDELVNMAKEKNISLNLILPQSPSLMVLADQVRVTEVLTNLIANAIAYTQSGGRVEVVLEIDANEVITHVKDTGEGIDPEAIPHLFHKFFRAKGKLEHGSRGTGLGLYISKKIIEMHRGRIWVESVLGKGSIFSFSLPKAGEPR